MISDSIALDWLKSCLREEQPEWPDRQDTSIADRIRQAGLEHGVLALCSHNLFNTPARETLPPEFQKLLKEHVQQAAAVELVQEHEIRQVLKMLHGEALSTLLMKGTPLAYSIYPQPYLRPRCDTDFLFPDKNTAERAWHVVQEMGYNRPSAVSGEFISHEFACYKSGRLGVEHALDFHWKLSNNQFFARTFTFNDLMAVAVPVANLSEHALAFDPEHALLHACMHRIGHKPQGDADRLIWLYDIHILARSFSQIQWDRLASLAVEKKLCNICLDGLQETKSALATPIPANVKKILHEKGKKENITADMGSTRWRMDLANFQTLPSWRERLLLLKEHFFPSAEYILTKYNTNNRFLLPFLYIRRVAQGITKRFR